MSDELKAKIFEFTEEVWHKGNLDALDDFLATDYVRHTNPGSREGGVDIHGIEDTRQSIAAMRAAFPDVHFANDDIMVDGDKVAARWTCTGTHRGEYRGIAPTGRQVKFIGINIFRLRDGKIIERWSVEERVHPLTATRGASPLASLRCPKIRRGRIRMPKHGRDLWLDCRGSITEVRRLSFVDRPATVRDRQDGGAGPRRS